MEIEEKKIDEKVKYVKEEITKNSKIEKLNEAVKIESEGK